MSTVRDFVFFVPVAYKNKFDYRLQLIHHSWIAEAIYFHCVEEAVDAVKNGADCLGVGAVFSTFTKNDAEIVEIETISEICRAVDVPVVAIGGLNKDNILKLSGSGVDGVALVSAIFSADNIEQECRELYRISETMVGR